ncbi:MAG: tail fiber domain-containing protein [Terriglobia bacterium]
MKNPHSRTKLTRLLATACLAFSPAALAVDPPPDGGYPNGNTAEGQDALFSLTSAGIDNTAIGFDALYSNTTGSLNTAIGYAALANTNGSFNTAIGWSALSKNTTGANNTATGVSALFFNTTGSNNTATGGDALAFNTTGYDDTASGNGALSSNTTGIVNTADGAGALFENTTGSYNTASGYSALFFNTVGNDNTASSAGALFSNTTGNNNTAVGDNALLANTTGSNNIALGDSSGSALTTGGDNIDIGNRGAAGESGMIRIGTEGSQAATFVAGIRTSPLVTGVAVAVGISPTGQLGVRASSARYKEAIKPMDKASEAVLSLEPVTFRYKKALDPEAIPQFGLIAEQVAKVDPDLVARDEEGKPYTVRYEAVNAMLLNEFLKEHRKVEALEATVAKLQATIEKVSARLDMKAAAPRLVENR